MIGDAIVEAILGTARPDAARAFYTDTLGLKLIEDNQFGMVLAGQIGFLRLAKLAAVIPSPNAVLSLVVSDVAAAAAALGMKGVKMERFGFLEQDAAGIWTAPDGTKVAWFRDPDLNLLSIMQRA